MHRPTDIFFCAACRRKHGRHRSLTASTAAAVVSGSSVVLPFHQQALPTTGLHETVTVKLSTVSHTLLG